MNHPQTIEAEGFCVSSRGVTSSSITTIEYGGAFNDKEMRDEFYERVG